MIHVELDINTKVINADAQEQIKAELRQRVLEFIFETVNAVATKHDYRFSHRDVGITGDVTVT